ncbi:MAG: glycogen/starch/alpha-glucan family phosphorylase, partial [Desulfovibrio sp.]
HSVNGVSAMHSEILVERVFKDFHELYPTKINNKTNGVTPRRWVMQCNPALRGLLKKQIGEEWILDLDQLRKIEPLADDAKFRKKWREMRLQNKKELAAHVKKIMGMDLNLETMFDVHIKRIHEYKRQLMNVLHVITLYNRILDNPEAEIVPRTVFFAGKAAPGYHMAKLIIKLINCVADTVNADPKVGGRLMALFLPNYRVSQAELLIPATDLSEQISMSGMEASGTGNMKFALNGALTIGTMDGANVEMSEEIGEENMFIFGHDADGIQNLKAGGYDPVSYVREDSELCRALDMIRSGAFSPSSPDLFKPLTDSLLCWGDQYCVLADYRSYVDKQQEAANLYLDQEEWTRRSILNTARMGKFSSDRSIAEYARDIWGVEIGAPTL